MSGHKIKGPGNPVDSDDAVNKYIYYRKVYGCNR